MGETRQTGVVPVRLTWSDQQVEGVVLWMAARYLAVSLGRAQVQPVRGTRVGIEIQVPEFGAIQAVATVSRTRPNPGSEGGARVELELDLDVEMPHLNDHNTKSRSPQPAVGTILTVGLPDADLLSRLGPVHQTSDEDDALHLLGSIPVSVLVLGPQLSPEAGVRLLDRSPEICRNGPIANIVLCVGESSDPFRRFVDRDQIYYLAHGALPSPQLASIVRGALSRASVPQSSGLPQIVVRSSQSLAVLSNRLSRQVDLDSAGRLTSGLVKRLLNADRAECLFYEPQTDVLWSGEPTGKDPDDDTNRWEAAAAGLVGFVARTGEPIRLNAAGEDLRFDNEPNSPDGRPDERLLAVPVLGPFQSILGVLTARRSASLPPFEEPDQYLLLAIGHCASTHISRLMLEHQTQQLAVLQSTNDCNMTPFRAEALKNYYSSAMEGGDLLDGIPKSLGLAHYLVVSAGIVGVLFLIFCRIGEYAEGPAIVRFKQKVEVTASESGVVERIVVHPGQRVSTGDLIAQLRDSSEAAELDRIDHEFELNLINSLRNPEGPVTGQALASLRAQRDLARARLAERKIVAPSKGVVADVRVRVGQPVNPGDLVTVLIDDTQFEAVALLPGQFAPQLDRGSLLTLTLTGYPDCYETLRIDWVADEVVGPSEASRYLSQASVDAIGLVGPAVVVQCEMRRRSFIAAGREYSFQDGMIGSARVRVKTERLLFALVPGLREAFRP